MEQLTPGGCGQGVRTMGPLHFASALNPPREYEPEWRLQAVAPDLRGVGQSVAQTVEPYYPAHVRDHRYLLLSDPL